MPLRLTFALHELVATMDATADAVLVDRFGISIADFRYLAALAATPADMTALAGRLTLTRAAVSKRVPVLTARGWVLTDTALPDRRRTVVRLTPAGERLVERAGDLLENLFAQLFALPRAKAAGLDADELEAQLRLLAGLITEKHR